MSNIRINAFASRKQYTYAGGTPIFVVDFPFFANTDLYVYLSDPANDYAQQDPQNILQYGVDYTVTGAGLNTGGTVTLTVSPTVGWTVTIVGRMPIDRFSIYENSSVISMAQLNEDMNRIVVMIKNIDTIIEQTMPKYDRSEYIQVARSQPDTPFSYVNLPMLLTGEVWTANATNTGLTKMFIGGSGSGNVISAHAGMRPSIARWTGTDFVLDDSEVNLPAGSAIYEPTAGTTEERTGFSDAWASMHWPAHTTAGRPAAPQNGDTYYDTVFGVFYGYKEGIWTPFAMGNGAANLWQRIFTQPGHTLEPGDLVYQETNGDFVLLSALDTERAEIQGMVVDPQPADPDQFLLQYGGEVDFSTWTSPVPLWAQGMPYGGVFFASDTAAGEGTLVPPVVNSEVNLPVFLAFGPLTGVLRHSRGMIIGGTPPISGSNPPPNTVTKIITQTNHGFEIDDWIYALPYNLADNEVAYAKGDSSAEVSSHVAGVVIDVLDNDTFVIQEGGICVGVVNTANNAPGSAITSGAVFYLSNTVPGKLMAAAPVTVGHYAVRCFECEQLATDDPGTSIDSGYILDKRPIIISAPGGAGSWQLISTIEINDGDTFVTGLENILDGTYSDVKIVFRNLVIRRLTPGAPTYVAMGLYLRVAIGGVVQNTINTYGPSNGPNGSVGYSAHRMLSSRNNWVNYPIDIEVDMKGVNISCFKLWSVIGKAWNVPPGTTAPVFGVNGRSFTSPPQDPAAGSADLGSFVGALTPLSGFYFFLDGTGYLPAPTTLEFTSGEVSVYGQVA